MPGLVAEHRSTIRLLPTVARTIDRRLGGLLVWKLRSRLPGKCVAFIGLLLRPRRMAGLHRPETLTTQADYRRPEVVDGQVRGSKLPMEGTCLLRSRFLAVADRRLGVPLIGCQSC